MNEKLGDAAFTEVLGSRYTILTALGEGSFGTVYKAQDRVLNRFVAVKSIRLDFSADTAERADMNQRFLREAQVAAQLNHPNIVTIHDIVSTPESSLIVMEFVEGASLCSILASRRRLGLAETTHLLSQVAGALDYAHEKGVIHRDVKPANILITRSQEVRVTDFGIAKTESQSDSSLTGTILGTPDYMSPEQAKGQPVDGRSDLFSLGCVFYECLVGEKPFKSASVTGVLLRILCDDPAPSVDWESLGLPLGLETVMQRILAKDPSERYTSGAAFVRELLSVSSIRTPDVQRTAESIETGEEAPRPRPAPLTSKNSGETDPPERASPATTDPVETTSSRPSYLDSLKDEDRVLCFAVDDPSALQSLDLSPDEAYIVSRIDGHTKPRELFAVSPLNEIETARTLLGLMEVGIIQFGMRSSGEKTASRAQPEITPTPPDPASEAAIREIERWYGLARFQDHAQFLGVARRADRTEIERAFQEKCARYNPSSYSHITKPEIHDKLRYLLRLTHESYRALARPASDRVPAPSPAGPPGKQTAADTSSPSGNGRRSAEEMYVRAERAYWNQDYWSAIELCRHAINISSDEAKYHHLLGLCLLENEHWREDAEESLRRATELAPDNREYLQALGSFYEKVGLSERAKEVFDRFDSASD